MTVLEYLPAHLKASQAAFGCLFYAVTQTDDPLIWHVDVLFGDEAAFAAYQDRLKVSPWGRATTDLRREMIRTNG